MSKAGCYDLKSKIFIAMAGLALAGCSQSSVGLMNLRSEGRGPDEFAITTYKPLEVTSAIAAAELPPPTPGRRNRADVTFDEILTKSIGYDESRGFKDRAFVAHTSRFGKEGDIRDLLAKSDAAFRENKKPRLMERVVAKSIYFDAYERETLDAYAERARLSALGVKSPNAPPLASE